MPAIVDASRVPEQEQKPDPVALDKERTRHSSSSPWASWAIRADDTCWEIREAGAVDCQGMHVVTGDRLLKYGTPWSPPPVAQKEPLVRLSSLALERNLLRRGGAIVPEFGFHMFYNLCRANERLDWSAQREYWTCFAAELAALSQHGDPLGFQRLSAEDKRKFLVSNPEQHLHALEPYSRVIEHLWSAEWKWLKVTPWWVLRPRLICISVRQAAAPSQHREWHVNQYHYAQRSEAGSVACTLISLLVVSAWRSHKDTDFIAGWLQQDAAQPAAWTACMREGARLMHLCLRDVVSKQQDELQLRMDQFCLPDEVCEVLLAGTLKNSKDAGWCRLRELAKEARWERLACGTSLRAAIELLCGHRLSLASHQEAAYILVSGNKSSLCIACSHSACSALHCDSHCFSVTATESSGSCLFHDPQGLEAYMCRGGRDALYRPEQPSHLYGGVYTQHRRGRCCCPPDPMQLTHTITYSTATSQTALSCKPECAPSLKRNMDKAFPEKVILLDTPPATPPRSKSSKLKQELDTPPRSKPAVPVFPPDGRGSKRGRSPASPNESVSLVKQEEAEQAFPAGPSESLSLVKQEEAEQAFPPDPSVCLSLVKHEEAEAEEADDSLPLSALRSPLPAVEPQLSSTAGPCTHRPLHSEKLKGRELRAQNKLIKQGADILYSYGITFQKPFFVAHNYNHPKHHWRDFQIAAAEGKLDEVTCEICKRLVQECMQGDGSKELKPQQPSRISMAERMEILRREEGIAELKKGRPPKAGIPREIPLHMRFFDWMSERRPGCYEHIEKCRVRCLVCDCVVDNKRGNSIHLLLQHESTDGHWAKTRATKLPRCQGIPVAKMDPGDYKAADYQASFDAWVREECPWSCSQSLPHACYMQEDGAWLRADQCEEAATELKEGDRACKKCCKLANDDRFIGRVVDWALTFDMISLLHALYTQNRVEHRRVTADMQHSDYADHLQPIYGVSDVGALSYGDVQQVLHRLQGNLPKAYLNDSGQKYLSARQDKLIQYEFPF
ncbi:unnamed protein product [Symbiodinium sp. KB8]|nr:unnamed protein product [Symbiodinium sp. KB8]